MSFQYTSRIPDDVLDTLLVMRRRAPSTWACTSMYVGIVLPYVYRVGLDVTDYRVVDEIHKQLNEREQRA